MKIILNKKKLNSFIESVKKDEDIITIKDKIRNFRDSIFDNNIENVKEENKISFDKDIFLSELEQILEAKSIERTKYYLNRLEKSINEVKTNKINDINLYRWKEYKDIITDSLWILDRRDKTGVHNGWYWGNFVPQIPHQMIIRYTKQGDYVLDTFMGSGTTLIECKRLGRNGIGIELNPEVVKKVKEILKKENNKYSIKTEIINGDSRTADIKSVLDKNNVKKVQLIIMHPPYHDIIKFSNKKEDLSTAKDIDEFLKMFDEVVENATKFLEKGRYLILVIGDKYIKGEWIPLGFYCMQKIIDRGYLLKSIIVKNYEETRGKRNQKELWRYRALAGGFYVFKHEYIMVFKKK